MRRTWLHRELARQIYEVTTLFTNNTDKLSTVLLVGGTDVATDLERCANGCSIIIGTPGRVHDILRRQDGPPTKNLEVCTRRPELCGGRVLTPEECDFQVLVLDEADTLLDLGFHDTINQILSFLPKQRRTGLFSATQVRHHSAHSWSVRRDYDEILSYPRGLSTYSIVRMLHNLFLSLSHCLLLLVSHVHARAKPLTPLFVSVPVPGSCLHGHALPCAAL